MNSLLAESDINSLPEEIVINLEFTTIDHINPSVTL